MARKLIVISGAPASGKTTMSVCLEKDLSVPLLAKDDIKEMLFDNLPQRDREWSRVQGKMAIAMLFAGAKELLLHDSPVMIESRFYPEYGRKDISDLLDETGADLLEVHCRLSHVERQRRWSLRSSTIRHPGHLDDPSAQIENLENEGPLFPENAIVVDTGVNADAYEQRCSSVAKQIREWLMKEG